MIKTLKITINNYYRKFMINIYKNNFSCQRPESTYFLTAARPEKTRFLATDEEKSYTTLVHK